MLNCIIDTILPKARMNWPSTPVSFMRRSTTSASFEVRISINSRLASGSSRSWGLIFQLGAEDRGEIADVLGDQEIMLHEAFDILHAGMLGISEPDGDLALHVERQPLFGAAGEEMDIAADRPQEIGAAAEGAVFLPVDHPASNRLIGLAHAAPIFPDPHHPLHLP